MSAYSWAQCLSIDLQCLLEGERSALSLQASTGVSSAATAGTLKFGVVWPGCAACRELGRLLRVNVMGYDYTGYGVCKGQPSIAATCCDIRAVLQSLEVDHGVKRHTVVLYGQSVGSGPTVRRNCWCLGMDHCVIQTV